MELINTYKNRNQLVNPRTSFRQVLRSFIDEHADVFEALTRQGTPFGNNWMVASQPKRAKNRPESVASIHRQLDELTLIIDELRTQINDVHVSAQVTATDYQVNNAHQSAKKPAEIGLTRFRAIQSGRQS